MKFSCDSCHAQYMISDEKVGAAGVRVRCKKCGNVIHVKRVEEEAPPQEDATVVMTADKLAQIRDQLDAARGIGPDAVTSPPKVTADEIGKAFDSMFSERTAEDGAVQPPQAAAPVAAEAAAPPPVGQDEDPDRAETRVLTAGDMQRISSELAPAPPPAVFDTENTVAAPYTARPASRPGVVVEWFVAIREEQVGPLTPEGVKERWDHGEVGPDTLVWCSGLPDWKPLSSVDELAHLVAPSPTATVRNGAGAAVQSSPSKAPPAPSVDEAKKDDLDEFKPSAASALASLASMAQEEMEAADRAKAAPKPPEPEPEPAPVRRSGPSRVDLFADLPPRAAVAAASAPMPVTAASSFGAPAALPDAYQPPPRRGADAAFGRPESSSKLILISAAALIVILAMGTVLFWALVLKPQKEAQDRKIAELAAAAELAKKAQTQAPAPTPPPAPVPTPAPVGPTGAVAVAKPPVPAPVPQPADDHKHHGGKHHEHHGDEAAAPNSAPSTPTAANPPTPAPGGKSDDFLNTPSSDIDKQFAQELDSNPDAKTTPTKHAPYIPPPPGQADLPQALGQSDVMEVIVEHKGNFAKCKADHPGGSGTVVVHWRIKPDGHTADVKRNGGDLDNPALAKCAQAQVSKLKFGQYRGPPMPPIDFPFSF